MTEDSSAPYIGTYVDYNPTDSSYYFYYTWRRFQGLQGDKGEQGISGMNGDDGLTYYTHIKYSDDGGRTFTSNNGETSGSYIGFCVDLNVNDPSYVGAYKWSKIKGDDGQDGQDANLLDWVEEWNGTKTTVNGTSVLSPKAYFGTVSGGKLSTGVLLGNNVYESGKAGIYGFSGGNLVFKLNSAGENTIGAFNITTQGLENNATPTAYVVIGKDGGKFFRVNRDSDCMCAIRGGQYHRTAGVRLRQLFHGGQRHRAGGDRHLCDKVCGKRGAYSPKYRSNQGERTVCQGTYPDRVRQRRDQR